MTARSNVVVLCLDSVRKDFFDEYAERTRALADVSLERCYAASSWSTPSHASMVSGALPSEHGIHTHDRHFRSLPERETLFGDLDGYAKVAVSSNVFAGPAFGFDRYFDAFEFVSQSKRFPGLDPEGYVLEMGLTDPRLVPTYLLDACRSDHTIKSLLNAGVGGLNLLSSSSSLLPQLFDKGTTPVLRRSRKQIAASDEPFFAFCNVMEGHVPHTPVRGYDRQYYPDVPNGWSSDERDVWDLCESAPDEYWRRREQVYAAAIDYVDRKLTAYVERVEALTDRETVFVVTSDHGDNHGRPSEDGMANHVSSLSEALIHVPFEVVNPPAEVATALERARERPTSHLQLRSVVAALAGGEGLSGTAELRVVPAELVGRAESSDPPSDEEYFDRAQRCCIRGREKVAWDSQGRVVRRTLDPSAPGWQSEPHRLDAVPAWAAEQFPIAIDRYKERAREAERPDDVDGAVRSRLRALGYAD